MSELFKICRDFVKSPTESLERYIRVWPVELGILVYGFFLISSGLSDNKVISLQMDILSTFVGNTDITFLIFYKLMTSSMAIIIVWYLMPVIVKKLSPLPETEFDAELYRKLILLAPAGYVIFVICLQLPFNIIISILAQNGSMDVSKALVATIVIFVKSILGLWGIAASIMIIVMNWKGLVKFFSLNDWQIVLVLFVIPFIFYLPLLIVMYPQLVEFISNSIS
ncbi:MAG: hypothetical protein DWP97_00560 [Calditrichaeota bacterium]|nr:MAG: hypothetical protein DWP97_00560 [Calditrichota bacterium]